MTFYEVLTKISERSEKVISDKSHIIQTNQRLYVRVPNGGWEEKELPPKIAPIQEELVKDKKK